MLCQALVLAQKSKDKLTTNLARLDDIDLKMKQQAAFQRLSEGIKLSTDVASMINKVCMDEGEFAGVLKDFQEQLIRSDVIMDAIDDSDLIPEAGEADTEVDALLAQLVPGMAMDSVYFNLIYIINRELQLIEMHMHQEQDKQYHSRYFIIYINVQVIKSSFFFI